MASIARFFRNVIPAEAFRGLHVEHVKRVYFERYRDSLPPGIVATRHEEHEGNYDEVVISLRALYGEHHCRRC